MASYRCTVAMFGSLATCPTMKLVPLVTRVFFSRKASLMIMQVLSLKAGGRRTEMRIQRD